MENYTQLCVWPGTLVGADSIKEFEEFMLEAMGARVIYEAEIKTLPDYENGQHVPETGGRNDLFFWVHDEDIPTFALKRLPYGIRWWEDVMSNARRNNNVIYAESVIEKYPLTW